MKESQHIPHCQESGHVLRGDVSEGILASALKGNHNEKVG